MGRDPHFLVFFILYTKEKFDYLLLISLLVIALEQNLHPLLLL
jgi:hypothetical protein